MNKQGLLKENPTVVFNIIYVLAAGYILGNKILDYMFESTSLTFGHMYVKSEGTERLSYIAVNEFDFMIWVCILYFVFLLSNIIIKRKDKTNYKIILPMNVCLMVIHTAVSLYYSINNYIFIQSTDKTYIHNELVMDSYGNVKICLAVIILLSVCCNIVLFFINRKKKLNLNLKTVMTGITFSSLPILIIPIVTLISILQM